MMPEINHYCGNNTVCVVLANVTFWFSYRTPVAFQVEGFNRVVVRNYWSTTTGKHLNAIDGGGTEAKERRVDREAFAWLWREQTQAQTQLAQKGW